MTLTLITAPATEPVTLAEAKAHCRVEHTADDTFITSLIVAARMAAEHELQRPLITQTWEASFDSFPSSSDGAGIPLGKYRPLAITSVMYLSTAGVDTTIDPAAYTLDAVNVPGLVYPLYGTSWPEARAVANSVRVRFTAGYGSAAAVPQCVKQWLLVMIGSMYAYREATTERAHAMMPYLSHLLDPDRVYL